jgi:predicted CXXCH cytochrome family protein
MKLRYVIEEISLNGTKNLRSSEINKPEILIGRGSDCDVRLESTYVSLRHAKIGYVDSRPYIEDPGSLSSVIVNGNIEKYRVLEAGDKIKLADITLEVFFQDDMWGLKETRVEKEETDDEVVIKNQNENLSISNHLPSIKLLSSLLFIAVTGYFFVWPLFGKDQESWSAGPLASHHSMIAADCKSCHGGDFTQVDDKKCMSCHSMTEHSEFLRTHKSTSTEGRCGTCHMEHNGDEGLVLNDPKLCTSCHANITATDPESKGQNVPSFEKHPEFSVQVQPAVPGGPYTKVMLTDFANLKDNSYVKLNHQIHLKPIRSKNGIVQLQCRDCHEASSDLKSINKITFDKHCRSCHSLEFDDRLKGKEVPHAQPDVVYKFLYAEYAKLMLGADDSPQATQTFNQRFKPGQALPSVESAPSTKDDFKQAFVEKESRNSERQLFTKTACYLCHKMLEKPSDSGTSDNGLSRFEVIKPQIPTDWMPAARFDHGAHEAIKCGDCHKGVYESTKTNQVLLPKIEQCRTCHVDKAQNGLVKSDCISCHSFHDQQLVPVIRKRDIAEILKSVPR